MPPEEIMESESPPSTAQNEEGSHPEPRLMITKMVSISGESRAINQFFPYSC